MIINTNPIYYFTTNRLRLKVRIRSICINLIVNVIRLREMGKRKKNETSNITRTTLWFLKFELAVCVLGGWVPARIAIDIQMDGWMESEFILCRWFRFESISIRRGSDACIPSEWSSKPIFRRPRIGLHANIEHKAKSKSQELPKQIHLIAF